MELSEQKLKKISLIKKNISSKKELQLVFKMGESGGWQHGYSKGFHKTGDTLTEAKKRYTKNFLSFVIVLGAQAVNLNSDFMNNCKKLIGKEKECQDIFMIAFEKGFIEGFNKGKKDSEKLKNSQKRERQEKRKYRGFENEGIYSSPSIHPDLERVNKLLQDQEILDWENRTGKYAPKGIRD